MTAWEIVAIAGSSLVITIGVLWSVLIGVWKKNEERLKKYEERENQWHIEMRELSSQVAEMEGRREGEKRGVELVVSAVIEDIRASRREAEQNKHT